jgi:hypothetical protein
MESLNIQSPFKKKASNKYSNPRALPCMNRVQPISQRTRGKTETGEMSDGKSESRKNKLHKKLLLTLTHIPYIDFMIIKEK